MHSYILALFGMFIGMLPRTSAAQLDLEEMLSETAIVEEEDSATDEILTEKEETKSQQEDIADDEDAEIPEVEDGEDTIATPEEDEDPEDSVDDEDIEEIEDTPQTQSVDDETVAKTDAEDDFMTQYLNEIEEQEKAPKSEAMRLMMQKDDTSVLPEDTQKLFEESAKIRQKQRERLLQSGDEEEEEEDTVETEDNAEDEETTADDAETTEAVTDEEDTEAEETDDAEDITETEEAEENEEVEEVEEAADASADSVTANESEEVKEAPKTSTQSATEIDESAADKTPPAPQKSVKSADKAPFGLTWGASIEQTQKAGFEMQEITFGEYVGTGLIKNPQQQRTFFDKIVAVFGTRNRLNAVFAQSPFIDDLPNAEKALKIYHTYYEALAKKYGNDKEHFIPNDENENSAIGNDRFLKDLQEGKASLFATFHNDIIKVTLSVAVNAEAKSYVTMDYENTLLQQQEKDADLNELMKDL